MKKKLIIVLIIFFTQILRVSSVSFAADLPTVVSLDQRLQNEIRKIINAGHLRPGLSNATEFYSSDGGKTRGNVDDYWANPADTIYTLLRAYDRVPNSAFPDDISKTWKQKIDEYIQLEYTTYKPYQFDHSGSAGAYREYNDVPTDTTYSGDYPVTTVPSTTVWAGWSFNPYNIYVLSKYAAHFHNAPSVLQQLRASGNSPKALPVDTALLQAQPRILNSYIAGYYGYISLQQQAGEAVDAQVQTWLNLALQKRVADFAIDPLQLNAFESGGFLWLTPELGAYLRSNSYVQAKSNIARHETLAPYWMVAKADEATRIRPALINEGATSHVYEYWSIFSAHAYILQQSQAELKAYLDVPSVWRGDLFYIQNLINTMEAAIVGVPTPTTSPITPTPTVPADTCSQKSIGDANCDGLINLVDFEQWRKEYMGTLTTKLADFNGDAAVNLGDFEIWRKGYFKI